MIERDTMEAALAELREMFPKMFCYIELHVQASWRPRRKSPEVDTQVEIQIDQPNGEVIFETTGATLPEAMQKVRVCIECAECPHVFTEAEVAAGRIKARGAIPATALRVSLMLSANLSGSRYRE